MAALTFYGGVGEIGGTKVLLEDGSHRLLLDFGLSYSKQKLFYEEYLRPRAGAGLLDFLEMGLLPPLEGIYRVDLEPPGLWRRYREAAGYRRLDRPDAVLLSHAHFDHSAHIAFLDGGIPIHSTVTTALLCKAIQDTGKSGLDLDIVSFAAKEREAPRGWKQEALLSERGPRVRRTFHARDAPLASLSSEARQFWAEGFWPESSDAPSAVQQTLGDGGECPLAVRCFPVDHSIRGACAWAIETSRGWVVYTGDLRRHGSRARDTDGFVEEAARLRPRALIIEGTNAGSATTVTESAVRENAAAAVRGAQGLVIADFSARDLERLLCFLAVAREAGRKLVILPRDAYLLKVLHLVDREFPDPAGEEDLLIYQKTSADRYPEKWQQSLYGEWASRVVLARDVGADQDRLILCFSFFDLNELPSIRPAAGSRYLFSSSEPHDEEQEIDFRRLHRWLDRFGLRSVGLPEERGGEWMIPEGEGGLHASGHASSADLVSIVRGINPAMVVPVHTERPGFYEESLRGSGIDVVQPEPFGSIEL